MKLAFGINRAARAAAALTIAAATTLLPAPAAHAEVGDVVYIANFQVNLTERPTRLGQEIKTSDTSGGVAAISPNGKFPDHWSNTATGGGTATINGLPAVGPVPCLPLFTLVGKAEVSWVPSGDKNKFDYTINTNPLAGSITVEARYTTGGLAGRTATVLPVVVAVNPDCGTNGLKWIAAANAVVTIK